MSNVSVNDLIPADLFHPGEHLFDELQARNLTQSAFSKAIGLSASVLNEIIKGKRDISPEIALKLEEGLGISAETWMNLQVQYDLDTVRQRHRKQIQESKQLNAPRKKTLMKALMS
ncbi:HigA family addiction module antitoxin [Runella zeae]|uniref:HigA family addiction module antitoxin n=1 Tax=Runella zeae TaxID=94255 RepID=UPI00235797CC|nr:HigA family addiction module antitoxin [Runella zeae]